LWLALLMAVPLHRQLEVWGSLDQYQFERNGVIGWLVAIETNAASTVEVPNRAKQIISVARQGATKRVDFGDRRSYQQIVKDNIINFIMKEEGSSLYRLMRAMKSAQEPTHTEQNPLTIGDFVSQQ